MVLFIFVGFKNKNELIGLFGFDKFVWLWWMVFEIVFIVLFCLIICVCNMFFIWSNLFFLFFIILDIGIFVVLERIFVIFLFVIFVRSKWFLLFFFFCFIVFWSCFLRVGILLYCNLDIFFKLFLWCVCFIVMWVFFSLVLMCCVLSKVDFLVF